MKVIYLSDTIARFGGIERVFVDKMNFLAEKYDYEIYLVTSSQGAHPILFPLSPKVRHIDLEINFHKIYQYPYPKRLWLMWKLDHMFRKRLKKLIREINPEIIITQTRWKTSTVCQLPNNIKKIIESHLAKAYTGEDEIRNKNGLKKWICILLQQQAFRLLKKKCDALVTLTPEDAHAWDITQKSHVIPNPYTYYPPVSSLLNTRKIISAGRLDKQKGYDMLIDVWEKVISIHPDWELHIYGDGPDKEALQQKIVEKKLAQSLFIHPSTHHIYEKFLESSLYVMSSRYEGFGLVLIEAMTCGLPCISFDCPYGPGDIITDGEDGFLIANNNIEQMAEKICLLIENENERKKMGKQAREHVTRFSQENIMQQWDALFQSLVKKDPPTL